jgi:hypothetical protein
LAKEIPLTRGFGAIVDDADYDFLARFKWSVAGNGLYAARMVNENGKSRTVFMHRLIVNAPDGLVVDHINGNKYDNRRSNLRAVDQQFNSWNRKRLNSTNTSGYMGVSWSKASKRWQANIRVNGKKVGLGYFDTPEDAALAYDKAARQRSAAAAFVNFPEVLP